VCNYITNGYSITTDSGWCETSGESLKIESIPKITTDNFLSTDPRAYGLELKTTTDKKTIQLFNSGFSDNLDKILPISKDQNFIARFKILKSNKDFFSDANPKIIIKKYKYTSNGFENVLKPSTIFKADLIYDSESKFYKATGAFFENIQQNETDDTLEKYGIFIEFTTSSASTFYLTQAELFEEYKVSSTKTIYPYGFYLNSDKEYP
jgi:hypothetical protein